MADNTTLNPGALGDSVRDLDKGGVKTQVVVIDAGGAGGEVLLAAGQALMAASLPVVIASNQTAVPVSLPAGLATSAKQDTQIADLDAIGTLLTTLTAKDYATQTTLAALNAKVTACNTGAVVLAAGTAVIGHVIVDGGGGGGPATIADAADVAEGGVADAIAAVGAAGTLSAKLRRVTQGLEDLKTLLVLAAGEAHLGAVGGNKAEVAVEITRPADVTAYAAGDSVNTSTTVPTVMTFVNFARVNGGSGYITKARLYTDKKSITPRIRVHLFNAVDPTLTNDNAAFKDIYTEDAKKIGFFDLPSMTTSADTTNSTASRSLDFSLRVPFVAGGATRSIYALLETLDGFTPASGEKFTLTLLADLD